jgi:hypothetical protein
MVCTDTAVKHAYCLNNEATGVAGRIITSSANHFQVPTADGGAVPVTSTWILGVDTYHTALSVRWSCWLRSHPHRSFLHNTLQLLAVAGSPAMHQLRMHQRIASQPNECLLPHMPPMYTTGGGCSSGGPQCCPPLPHQHNTTKHKMAAATHPGALQLLHLMLWNAHRWHAPVLVLLQTTTPSTVPLCTGTGDAPQGGGGGNPIVGPRRAEQHTALCYMYKHQLPLLLPVAAQRGQPQGQACMHHTPHQTPWYAPNRMTWH